MLVYRSVIVTGIVTIDQLTSRRSCPGHGQARSRLAAELAGYLIALDLAATVAHLHHRPPGDPSGQCRDAF
jgi:hypothetical protein